MDDSIKEKLRICAKLIEKSSQVVLVGHERADGDVIGSMVALTHRLRSLGKNVAAFLFEPIAYRYAFLDFEENVRVFDADDAAHRAVVECADALILLDASTEDRLPGWDALFEKKRAVLVRFDHHPSTAPIPAEIDITDVTASATGQLVCEFLKELGLPLKLEEALGLFVAIATDTGWFRYSNTTPDALRQVSEFLEIGIEPALIYRSIYQTNELDMIRLVGRVIAGIQSEMDGRLLWGIVDLDLIRAAGIDNEFEADILMDVLRSSKGAQCVALFRETRDGKVRINLRSKGEVAVNKVAEMFGGGGHRNASGATINGSTLERSASRVVEALKKELEKSDSGK
jgi:phosphoesterase RecJ-like protein